jgi:hypothetical protein
MIKFDLNKLLKDSSATSRLLLILFLSLFFLSPGLMALAYLDMNLFVELSEFKLILLSFGLSVLLVVLAAVYAISPRSVHVVIYQNPSAIIRYIISFGTMTWAYLFVLIIPAFIHYNAEYMPWLENLSYNMKLAAMYLIFLFFGIFFNAYQFSKTLSKHRNA